eukprot:gnl/Dysnectes_brevis/3092_a3845_1164.p1 GENE.gnl/Dysnectes_brevis/3092_a3845_1164~~gnl/Dysnectes_brevis/3092_a3845_1164.p1  ORF type:complete len:575 (+),score=153.76 gnl/Dysnectes_brevis/3092_a3845_1164:63-1727(+)
MSVLTGNIIDARNKRTYLAKITMAKDKIDSIEELGSESPSHPYFIPPFVDSHIHLESSLMHPYEFVRISSTHGTGAVVCDPHELANVVGAEAVSYFCEAAKVVKDAQRIIVALPSATLPDLSLGQLETTGGHISLEDAERLIKAYPEELRVLGEVMVVPAVLGGHPGLLGLMKMARDNGLNIDGHCPCLGGDDLRKYCAEGVTTCHESSSIAEGEEKLSIPGFVLQIRQGSAARNLEALHPLIASHAGRVMLCTDDAHAPDLAKGHINGICADALDLGHDLYDVVTAGCVVPNKHYGVGLGQLKVGDPADIVVLPSKDSAGFRSVSALYRNGKLIARDGRCELKWEIAHPLPNQWVSPKPALMPSDLTLRGGEVHVIRVIDGELLTRAERATIQEGFEGDVSRDMAKLVVWGRYKSAKPSVGIVAGLGLRRGAFGASIGHDAHNIIVCGQDDASIQVVLNEIARMEGGAAVACDGKLMSSIPLPLGGLMSDKPGEEVAASFATLREQVQELGCQVRAPFILISFLALPVIPSLRLTDKGLCDVSKFSLVPLYVE